MPIFISILALGFLLGLRHATDADHVVAITTITTKQKHIKGSTLIGALWGIGHSVTVTLVGIPIIFFSLKIPAKIGLGLEFCVGTMLVILGTINLYNYKNQVAKTLTRLVHGHEHSHFSTRKHSHLHFHLPKKLDEQNHHLSLFQIIRPIFVGLVHGLAGSTAIALLILTTIHKTTFAAFYLIVFNIGVIIGMMIITTLIGTSIKLANKKIEFLHKYLVAGSGLLSFVFGLYIMYQIGFVDGFLK